MKRMQAKKPKHFVDDLRTGLQERLDVEAVELAELERISIAKILSWVGFAVLAFFLLTLVSNWSDIVEAMSGMDWTYVLPIVIDGPVDVVACLRCARKPIAQSMWNLAKSFRPFHTSKRSSAEISRSRVLSESCLACLR